MFGRKRERKEVEGVFDEDDFPGSIEEATDGLGVPEGGFLHNLSAGSAGGDRLWGELALLVAGGNGYGFHLLVGISASGIEQCRALGAKSGGIGGIFLVAATDDGAVGQTKCCTYGKTGVGRIAVGGSADGLFDECAIGGMQLVQRVVFGVGDKKLLFFHGECGVDGRNIGASKIQRKEDLAKRCRAFSKKMQRFSEKDAGVFRKGCRAFGDFMQRKQRSASAK